MSYFIETAITVHQVPAPTPEIHTAEGKIGIHLGLCK